MALNLALSNAKVGDSELKGANELLQQLSDEKESCDWLIPETEKFVQKVAMYNATSRIIQIQSNADLPLEQRNRKIPEIGAITEIMGEE